MNQAGIRITPAVDADAEAIASAISANRDDPAIFLRTARELRHAISELIVAKDLGGNILGCAALHRYSPHLAEILSVSVLPDHQREGIGSLLLDHILRQADEEGIQNVWLATLKPDYFRRFGFEPMSLWKLPAGVLATKLRQVVAQPFLRWPPVLFGRFTFMERVV